MSQKVDYLKEKIANCQNEVRIGRGWERLCHTERKGNEEKSVTYSSSSPSFVESFSQSNHHVISPPLSLSFPPLNSSFSPPSVNSTHSSDSKLSFLFFNARSILPKLEELSASCSIYLPDVICVVETWLSSDILDSEISLPGFSLFRRDRNRHGGGVLVYIQSGLFSSEIKLASSLEFILLSIKTKKSVFHLGTFYHPPSASSDLDSLIHLFSSSLSSLRNLILLGDFNIDFLSESSSKSKLNIFAESLSLIQIVDHPTHFSHSNNPSLIDLVFLSSSIVKLTHAVLPPISSSDHSTILFSVSSDSLSGPIQPIIPCGFIMKLILISLTFFLTLLIGMISCLWRIPILLG